MKTHSVDGHKILSRSAHPPIFLGRKRQNQDLFAPSKSDVADLGRQKWIAVPTS
ncbi:hypothetical protein SAMN05216387_1061, partial [Nitrosovibrio tenuis]